MIKRGEFSLMIESCDVGSLPFFGDSQKFSSGASSYGRLVNNCTIFFENKVVNGFLDKIYAGIDVPNYPQFRDMNQMFIEIIEGLTKVDEGYVEMAPLTIKQGEGAIPESAAIRNNSQRIHEILGKPFKLRLCITGPYTMSSSLAYKDKETFIRFGRVLAEIIDKNVFSNQHGSVQLVSLDEPILGFIDDPLLDRGSEGRENLLKAWGFITHKIRAKGAQACLHLHNTSDELFWEPEAPEIIESHINDLFYDAKRTKERLESTDRFLKASIATTDFDQLIRTNIITFSREDLNKNSLNEEIANIWTRISRKEIDPTIFLEDVRILRERMVKIVEKFGAHRIPYAGPECGLRSYPTYKSALECLKRVARTTADMGE